MKLHIYILVPLVLFITGCATSMHVPEATTQIVRPMDENTEVRPLAFSRGVVKINRGQQIGMTQGGLLCIPQPNSQILWKGGRVDFTDDEMIEIFQEELRKENYPVVGDTSSLFVDRDKTAAELQVAALIKDIRMNVCYPMSGFANFRDAKGKGYIQVEWQIFSVLDREVILKVSTEGSSEITSATATGAGDILYNAFAQATKNLLANKDFHQAVVRGNDGIAPEKQSFPPLLIRAIPISSENISSVMNDVRLATVTVRAGTGHGSGVIIGQGEHILTNYHVVGESQYVKAITITGREILGEVVRKDKARDVAIIQTESTGIQGLPIQTKQPQIGSEVYAIGSPLLEELNTTVSRGIVSSYRDMGGLEYIQSDVNIQPGNSGGPLLDESGNIVAIAVAGYRGAGINLFIPIRDALSYLSINQERLTSSSIK